jgi:hypothetical protein
VSQLGQGQELDQEAMSKGRTEHDLTKSDTGLAESTTGAQRIGPFGGTVLDGNDDLALVLQTWHRLPRVVQGAILAMVKATISNCEKNEE